MDLDIDLLDNCLVEEQNLTCILKFHPEHAEEAKKYLRKLPQQHMFVGKLHTVESEGIVIDCEKNTDRITVIIPWAILISINVFADQRIHPIGFC